MYGNLNVIGGKKILKHKCNDMQCMTRLTVEQVLEAAEKMLALHEGR
jgi:hypothetical protein